MKFLVAAKSVFFALGGALKSTHIWRYEEFHDVRSCTVCGRREELTLDLVSSDWDVVEPGDETAHAIRPGLPKPVRPVDPGAFPAPAPSSKHMP